MSKESLKKKLERKRKELAERGGSGLMFFPKEGKTRFRILPVTDDYNDGDWAIEVVQFYLGSKLKGLISRSTIGEDCPIMDQYHAWKESGDPDDQGKAKDLRPRTKYLLPALLYKDERGKELDTDRGITLIMVPSSAYKNIIDFFLDPELGDFTDPIEGYDIKLSRTGSGLTDTEYSVSPMRPSELPKKYRTPLNLNDWVKKVLPTEDEVEEKFAEYLAIQEEEVTKEPRKGKKKTKKHRKPKGDIE